jgi:zinc protease
MKLNMGTAVLWFLATTVVYSTAAPQTVEEMSQRLPVDPRVTVGTLDNGLRYYVRANKRPENRAELQLVVNVGSVLEDEDQRGLAHFVEHMAFNGTEGFPRQALVDYLERIGMTFGPEINASTSFDETIYTLTVPTDSAEILATAFQILEEWAHRLAFDPEMIDGERGVVIEEWRGGRGAGARMFNRQFPVLFKDSRYAERLPIGDVESLESFEHEALTRFYRDWYRPDLMAVVAVGDFDSAEIERLIRHHFSTLPTRDEPRPRNVYPVPDHDETLVTIATDPEATESGVSIYFKQPRRTTVTVGDYRRLIVERLYNRLLNNRLFELTQQPDPPFMYASSGQGRLIRSKEVYVLGASVADGGIVRGLESILTEAERVALHGFVPTELEREKAELLRLMAHAYAEREKTHSAAYAREYAAAFLTGEPIPGVPIEYELYALHLPGIVIEEVNGLAREWLTNQNRVVLVNAPEKDGVSVPTESELLAVFDAVRSQEIVAYDDSVEDGPLVLDELIPGEIVSEIAIEEIGVTRWHLSNGARVVLRPSDFKDDEILFRATSPGGTSLATDEDYIAASTAGMVVSAAGLGSFDLVALQKKLAGKVAGVTPSIGELYETLGGSAIPEDVETLFQLIYLSFTAPRRDSNAYLAFRSQVETFLANRTADPVETFHDSLTVALSQHHFRHRPPTIEVYDEMDLDRSYAFYRDRFADAGDFTFIFVGNFDVETMRPLVRTYLATLPSTGRVESWVDTGIRPPRGVVRKTVRRGVEPRSQTSIVITGPVEYTRENRHLVSSLTELLQIKLRERLREDLGGTYTVTVGGTTEREPVPSYSIQVSFGADPDRLNELTDAVFDEMNRLKLEGPSDDDVIKVKEAQRRSHETSLEQNGFWLFQLLYADRYGLDPRNILNYVQMIDGLTVGKLQDAAVRFLTDDNYVQVSLYPKGGG